MPEKSSVRFALVENRYLFLEELRVRQVVIEIPLPEPVDPLVHQRIRDDEAVTRAVAEARTAVNRLVVTRLRDANVNVQRVTGRQRGAKKAQIRQRRASALEGDVRKALERLEPTIGAAVRVAHRKQVTTKAQYDASVTRWRVGVVFSSASFLLKALGVTAGNVPAMASIASDLWSAVDALWQLSKDEATLRAELTAMFEQIRAKSTTSEPRSWLGSAYGLVSSTVSSLWYGSLTSSSVQTKLKAYEDKLDALEYGAGALATKLEALLDELETKAGGEGSEEVTRLIALITQDASTVAVGKSFVARCRSALAAAERRGAFSDVADFLLPYARTWGFFLAIGYYGTGDRSFQFVADELRKRAHKLPAQTVEKLTESIEEVVCDALKRRQLASFRGMQLTGEDVYKLLKIAVDPPEDDKAKGALAAELAGHLLDKVGDSELKFDAVLFDSVLEGAKQFCDDVKDALEDDDEDEEAGGDDTGGDDTGG